MSATGASFGDKPADPYTKVNKDEVDLQTKVTDLVDFITKCKFGMMTTIEASSQNNLVSRCMGLAATVGRDDIMPECSLRIDILIGIRRH